MAHFNVLMHCISDMFPGWSLDFESTWDFMQPDHSWTFFQIAKIICFDAQLNLTLTLRKSSPPTLRAGSPEPRVSIFRKWHMTSSIWLLEVIFRVRKPRTTSQNFYFRFSFPVHRSLKIALPVWGDSTKMCRIKFQRESLETFLVYDVVMGAINGHLRVAGSPEPARSVSDKLIILGLTYWRGKC